MGSSGKELFASTVEAAGRWVAMAFHERGSSAASLPDCA